MNKKWLRVFAVPLEQADSPHIEINGNKQLLADGCVGVLHYDGCEVCLNCGSLALKIEGQDLQLHHLGNDEAEVTGCIRAVKWV